MDERRAIKIISALLFFPDPEGKQRETEIVSGMKKVGLISKKPILKAE